MKGDIYFLNTEAVDTIRSSTQMKLGDCGLVTSLTYSYKAVSASHLFQEEK